MNSSTTTTVPATNVFATGNYTTSLIKSEAQSNISDYPPKHLLIASPTEEGIYPLLLFLHGYLLYNSFYSQLLQHIASHGFIVIAPQLYCIAGPDASEEIEMTAQITKWLSHGLAHFLSPQVRPNLAKLALAGHSRGAKVAFALSLKQNQNKDYNNTFPKISALIGVDPVDGMGRGKQTSPPVLTYVPHSFNLSGMGVLIVGSGLGELKRNPLFPPCAPKSVNHEDFYRECRKPAYYFVAKNYGHLDVLDDETRGLRGKATCLLCKNGERREPMRKFVGGIVVAFLREHLEGDSRDIVGIREGRQELPLELQRMEFQV